MWGGGGRGRLQAVFDVGGCGRLQAADIGDRQGGLQAGGGDEVQV